MDIINFSDYIKESQINILDLVIDENGKLYNNPIIKGNVDNINRLIIGSTDNKNYIAGIERTGKLFSFLPIDELGNILLNGNKIRMPDNLIEGRVFWNKIEDYTRLLPIVATGLVNVKIDMEVIKKIKRFSKNFSNRIGIDGFKDRLELLSKDTKYRLRTTKTIQRELSGIMMLHHLNELKTHFDPSSAGFLFESYVAGLIPGCSVREDNSSIDLEDKRGNTYQIKLLQPMSISKLDGKDRRRGGVSGFPIRRDEKGNYLSYYIISFKYADKVRIFILDGRNTELPEYIENFKVRTGADNFSDLNFSTYNQNNCNFVYDISLINIDNKIDNIAKGLKSTLETLYKNLSEFQYNVETILTGVDEEGNIIEANEFARLEISSEININVMKNELKSIIGIIKK